MNWWEFSSSDTDPDPPTPLFSAMNRKFPSPPYTKQRTTLTMLGSFGFNPISANGFKPAMSPKPIGPFSCVSGSCGFWPACIVGSCCGVLLCAAGPERAAPFTMWIVCDVWILYVDSASSSFSTRPVCASVRRARSER